VGRHAHAGVSDRATGGRFIAGDPLRAVAAISIMVLHAGVFSAFYRTGRFGYAEEVLPSVLPSALGQSVAFLQVGLYIFFALSGYLIARPFIRAFVAGDPMPSISNYARNRLLRIVPGFWLIFTLALLVAGTLGTSAADVASVYLFFENNHESRLFQLLGQSWTLQVEMAYYLLIPLVAGAMTYFAGRRLGPRGRLVLVAATSVAVGIGSLVVRQLDALDTEWQRTPPTMLFAFVPGVLLAAVEIPAEGRLRGQHLGRPLALGMLVLGVAILVPFNAIPVESAALRGLVEACGTGLVVGGALALQWSTGSGWRPLDNRVMHWLGKRSYSIYLLHQAVFYELRSLSRAPESSTVAFLVTLLVGGAIVIALSALTYRFFEEPFLRRRRGWRSPTREHDPRVRRVAATPRGGAGMAARRGGSSPRRRR
jgi:acetyltransferase